MRRLAEFMKIGFYSRMHRAGWSLAIVTLLALTLATFTPLAHAQGVLTSDFEDGGMDGWGKNGSPTTVENSTDMAHGGSHSLKVAGRTNTWDGPGRQMLGVMNAGEAWEFSVWVRLAPGEAPDSLALQVHDPVDSSGWGGYPLATYKLQVTDQAWVQLKGRYPGSGMLNPGGTDLNLYMTSDKGSTSYYMDDFVAYKQQPSGCAASPDIDGDKSEFEGELNWAPRPYSNVTVALTNADKHTGAFSMLQSGRTQPWNTAGYLATGKMCNGSSYKISVWVKMAPGMPSADMNVQLKASATGKADAYLTLTPTQTVTDQAWVQLTGTYDMLTDYEILWLYVNPGSDATSSYYVDDFSIMYLPPGQAVEPIASIGAAYKSYFPVGAAVYGPDVDSANLHSDLLALHFTSVTAENAMKWDATESSENVFDYSKADAIVAFAKSHTMAVRGHALVWHQQTPDWVFKDANGVDMSTLPYSDANKALLFARMKNHIQNLITHFGGDVTSWDVVNEAFDESSQGVNGFRKSKWYIIAGGPSYIDAAFQYAKEAVDAAGLTGKVKLYLNEYNTTVPSKLNFVTTYLADAKTRDIPIDGVGHQFHNKLDWPINDDPASINAVTGAINAVANLGFDNQVTEMDISIYRVNAPGQTLYQSYADVVANLQNEFVIQGYRYRDYFSAFKTLAEAGKLSSVTLWGQADDHTWLTSASKTDAPLPFDNNFTHKPAYTGIMDAQSLPNALPYAASASAEVIYNTPLAITLMASDANLDPLTYTIVTPPSHGSLSAVVENKVTYTPATDYSGPDTFTFSVNDGKGDSNLATVTLNVVGPPVAADQSITMDLNTTKSITLAATTTGQAALTYTIVAQPQHGTLTGTLPAATYAPNTDYWGPDTFTFKANNGTDSNVATVSINVLPATAVAKDQAITVQYNTPTLITLSSTGNGTMTYSIVKYPKGAGKLVATPEGQNTTWMYTNDTTLDPYLANPTDVEKDSITFKVNNGHDSAIATVSITLKPAALKVALAPGQSASQSISAGGTATYNLQVNGYMAYSSHNTAPVSFACGGIPNYATCTVTPKEVQLDDNMTPVSFSVTVKTNTAAAAAASMSAPGSWPNMPWIPAGVIATFALLLITMKKAKLQWRMVGATAVLLVVATFPGCGGNTPKTNNDMVSTPAGTYTVTVTAIGTRSISNAPQSDWKVTGEIPLTLTVN